MTLIIPSILSADFARLGAQVAEAQAGGADRVQVDVMDGRFVPNITVGPLIVEAVRRDTTLPIEAHLMIVEPERYLDDFAAAGADMHHRASGGLAAPATARSSASTSLASARVSRSTRRPR